MPLPSELLQHGEISVLDSSAVAFKKNASGELHLTNLKIVYFATGVDTTQPLVVIPIVTIKRQLLSKAGLAKVSWRIELKGATDEDADKPGPTYTFNFTAAPQAVALEERETFRVQLAPLIVERTAEAKEALGDMMRHTAWDNRGETAYKARISMLMGDPELAKLHEELVGGGVLEEDEFWEGRTEALEAQASFNAQSRGPETGWLELKPRTEEGKDIRYTLTPTVIESIFRQDPGVRKAYMGNVPEVVSEEVFWQRYLRSRYFHRNRLSGKASGAESDPIFDKALEDDEEEVRAAPERAALVDVNFLLDLATTKEDHWEGGNRADKTMRPGTDESAISLIRRFNRHSQTVVESVTAGKRARQMEKGKGREDEAVDETEAEILLDDLQIHRPPKRIALNLKDVDKAYFQSSSANSDGDLRRDVTSKLDIQKLIGGMKTSMEAARSADTPPIAPALATQAFGMLDGGMLREAEGGNAASQNLPAGSLVRLTTLHASATELLRHFWAISQVETEELQGKARRILLKLKEVEEQVGEAVGTRKEAADTVSTLLEALGRAYRRFPVMG